MVHRPVEVGQPEAPVHLFPYPQMLFLFGKADEMLLVDPSAFGHRAHRIGVEVGQWLLALQLVGDQPFADPDDPYDVVPELVEGVVEPRHQVGQGHVGVEHRQENPESQRDAVFPHQFEDGVVASRRIQPPAGRDGAAHVEQVGEPHREGELHLVLGLADCVGVAVKRAQGLPGRDRVLSLGDGAVVADGHPVLPKEVPGERIGRARPPVRDRQVNRVIRRGGVEFGQGRVTPFGELSGMNAPERAQKLALRDDPGARLDHR